MPKVLTLAALSEHIEQLTSRITQLERETGRVPEIADRRDLDALKEKYKQRGLSGKQAKNAAWKELHRVGG